MAKNSITDTQSLNILYQGQHTEENLYQLLHIKLLQPDRHPLTQSHDFSLFSLKVRGIIAIYFYSEVMCHICEVLRLFVHVCSSNKVDLKKPYWCMPMHTPLFMLYICL